MQSPPAYGYEEAVGLGVEASYGSAVSPDVWFRAVSCSLRTVDPPQMMAGPSGASVDWRYDATLPRHFRGVRQVAGTIVFEAEYDDVGYLLQNALSTVSTSDDDPVAGAYTHTFDLPATPEALPASLTIARLTGMEDLRFAGCMINNMEISGAPDRIVTVSCEVIGQTGGDSETDDTIGSLSQAPWVEFHDSKFRYHATVSTASGSLTDQTSGKDVAEWSVRVENNLRAQAAAGSGTRGIREPIRQGKQRVILAFSRDYLDDTWFDHLFPAAETGAYAAVAVKATSEEYITGTTPYSLDLYMPAGIVLGDPTEYGGGGDIIPESVRIEAAYDGSNAPFTATLINGTSAYT